MTAAKIDTTAPLSGKSIGLGHTRHTQETRIALLRVAERLFGQHGIEGVSLRQIAHEAGHANPNVVKYHFETKENLLHTLMLWRISLMEQRRTAMLKQAEVDGRLNDIDTLLRIVCLPHLDLADKDGQHPYAHFMTQYQVHMRPMGIPHPYDRPEDPIPALRQTLGLIEQRLFFLRLDIAQMRNRSCSIMFLQNLTFYDLSIRAGTAMPPLMDWIEDVIAMMCGAMLAAPPATTTAKTMLSIECGA